MSGPVFLHGFKVVEMPMPDNVQFALVTQKQAAICVTGGEILMAERMDSDHWWPRITAEEA